MNRRFAPEGSAGRRSAPSRRRIRLIPLLLELIGAVTVLVMAARYLVVPLLVYLGGAL